MADLIPLPIDPLLSEIAKSVRDHSHVILTATPGAGKTTRLPPELLNSVKGKVVVLCPRRMAAIAACARVCEERGWEEGKEAGYQVRFDNRVGPATRLIFMTDALLLRRMIDDPELNEIDLVVLDEFHERNLNQDLILGAVKELQDLGRDIKLLVMSATLDCERLQRFLPGSTVIEVPGKVFPLQIEYSSKYLRPRADAAFYEHLTGVITATEKRNPGDILVFLPGTGEIVRTEERLRGRTGRKVARLHGSLSLNDQREVLRVPREPRVILSTNVAEASVTVQGVDCVIDSGLAKIMSMNPQTGFSALETQRIAKFNARQRAGRAARQKEGLCIRLWTEHEEITMAEEPEPECRRVDLAQALLWLAHLGVSEFNSFAWYDLPSAPLMNWATRSLRDLGALDKNHRLTELGARLIQFPLEPRLGALLALGEKFGEGRLASDLASILNERDFADGAELYGASECDMLARLELLREAQNRRGGSSSLSARVRGLQNVLESSRSLRRLLKERMTAGGEAGIDEHMVRRLLLLSHSDRLCRRRGKTERAVMVGGRGVRLSGGSQVRESEFFVALQGVDLPGQADTLISTACGFDKNFVLKNLSERISVSEDIYFDDKKEQFFSRRVRKMDDLTLDEPSLTPVSPGALGERMVDFLVFRWDWLRSKHDGLREWMLRLRFLAQHEPSYATLVTPKVIRQVAEMAASDRTRMDEILAQDLVSFIETAVGREAARTLAKEVPRSYTAPSGFSHPVLYEEMHSAFVEVRLQEMFGLAATPRIAFGKAPLTFRLLGPNFRPVQVTSDLAGFWRGGYQEVRKELRARYPKHSWPEDPLQAKPEAKGRRG